MLCKEYNKIENIKILDIANFLVFFGQKHPNFEGYIQQDAHEFMTLLLEDINIELNENLNNIEYKQINFCNIQIEIILI